MYISRTESLIKQYKEILEWIDLTRYKMSREDKSSFNCVKDNGLKLLYEHTKINLEKLENEIENNHKILLILKELIKERLQKEDCDKDFKVILDTINYQLERKDICCGIECIHRCINYIFDKTVDPSKGEKENYEKYLLFRKLVLIGRKRYYLDSMFDKYKISIKFLVNNDELFDSSNIDTYFDELIISVKPGKGESLFYSETIESYNNIIINQ